MAKTFCFVLFVYLKSALQSSAYFEFFKYKCIETKFFFVFVFSAYNRQWKEAQTALDDLLKQELPPEPPKPEKDRQAAAQLLATMYIKYIQVIHFVFCYSLFATVYIKCIQVIAYIVVTILPPNTFR